MLFQDDAEPILFIIWLLLATIIVALIIYIVVLLLESKTKAKDKIFLIIILAFIIVLLLPVVLNAINEVLIAIGDALADIRNAINAWTVNIPDRNINYTNPYDGGENTVEVICEILKHHPLSFGKRFNDIKTN